jgi:hypothetical protein
VNISDIAFSNPKPDTEDRFSVNVACTATTFRFLEQAPQEASGEAAKGKAPGTGKGKAK